MKKNLGSILKNILPPISLERLRGVRDIAHLGKGVSRLQGKFLQTQYPDLIAQASAKARLAAHEYKAFSQYGEDGLLLHIFSQIGVSNFTFAEIGIGSGRECNTATFSTYFGWQGLLIDADQNNVNLARAHYDSCLGADSERVKIAQHLVTAENVNDIFSAHNLVGVIDLLSIDIDGNDYWVCRAINELKPRVVVMEYNASFGPERSITVEYDPAFDRHEKHESGIYHGASLTALANIANAKGYRLIGCESHGVNAFFLREDITTKKLPAVTPAEAYYPHAERCKLITTEEQFELVKHLPFVTIEDMR